MISLITPIPRSFYSRSYVHSVYFQLFNSGMDALLSQQGEWRVSSALLRDILGAQLLRKIFPLFKDFYGKYSKVSFSKKHMNEYLRFPPDDVDRALTNFFGKS